ncbi:MAG: ribosomal-protein-alanine N-acetyltransferase [Gammaproteobacteria bacterium HGW-Gammaproteobacteria-7]|nr:MAG: ribosomal-protein-alanine N-acetyltransferase [Gammaproteobacteria bacterium HGW-Gammaproteobacteria-7]
MSARPSESAAPVPTLRHLRESDIDAVMVVEQSAYEFPWTRGIFVDCLRAGYSCWLLEQDGAILGYTVVSVAADEAHILNLCVAPRFQGRGLSKRLLKRALDTALWYDAQRIFLEVRPSNVPAIALYSNAGFNEIGTRPNYYPARNGREDAIVMARELLPPEVA